MPPHIVAIMVTTIVGMVLAYKLVRLILIPPEYRVDPGSGKKGKRGKRHHHAPPPIDNDDLDALLARAEDLTKRVGILEEIVSADQRKDAPEPDRAGDPMARPGTERP